MGVLLSICFKSKEEQANPQHQVKQRRGASKRQQKAGGSKQHLLSDGPSLFSGYNAQSSQSPPPHPVERQPSWGKPPPSPHAKDDGKDPPEQFAPNSPMSQSPEVREKKERDNKNKRFQLNRTISLHVPGSASQNEDGSPKRKRSFKSRKGSTRRK